MRAPFLPLGLLLMCLGAANLVAGELEFSHKLHLTKGLVCATCHSTAASSEKETDHNLPGPVLCQACHNGKTAPEVDASALEDRRSTPRSFWFNHSFHLQMGDIAPVLTAAIDSGTRLGPLDPDLRARLDSDNACLACHRGLDQADAVDSKLHLPQMADCLTCHDHVDNPFSCEKCHSSEVRIKPDDHTREFVDQHSTGKLSPAEKLTCQPCHGRNFRCMGCH